LKIWTKTSCHPCFMILNLASFRLGVNVIVS
jgi:hypothetical protein